MAATVLNTNTPLAQAGGAFSSTFNVNTGNNLIAYALLAYNNSAGLSVSAITLGGRTMSSVGAAAFNSTYNGYAQAFRLQAPPTGTPTLAITVTGANEIWANLVIIKDASQDTVPERSYVTTTGNSTTVIVTVPSNSQDVAICCDEGNSSNAITTNQTSLGTSGTGTDSIGTARGTTPGDSIDFTWTPTGIQIASIGFSVKAYTTPTTYRRNIIQQRYEDLW